MAKINELREKRAKIWEQAKAFLDSHRNETGILSAEDTAAYEKMEKDIVDLGHEIERQQRADELERELNLPTSTPLVSKPDNANRESKTGTASEKYNKAFWNQMRNRSTQEVRNILSEGVDSEGGFLVPETFENTLVQALDDELVIRQLAHTFTTASNAHKIPVVATRGKAMWTEENAAITYSDTSFGQKTIGAHMLPKQEKKKSQSKSSGVAKGRARQQATNENHKPEWRWDDHSRWGMYEEDAALRDVWVKRFEDAAQALEIRDPSNSRGLLPRFAQRILGELRKPQTDWRTILNDFIQEEVADYSFSPPDRRFDDCPFFLPDFNGKEDIMEDILFMIDTSASMSDAMITAAYSEVKGAIDQFDGKLKGWLGFFDAAIIKPKPFSSEEEFSIIRPAGGGGTDFQIIFEYVHKHMQYKLPASIIILTDGYAPFPQEKLSMNIPVLWLINNNDVDPPWGKVARITV